MKIIITSGGTREPIDPVRYIGNYSSGKMGAALSKVYKKHKVVVISGPTEADYFGKVIQVQTAEQMLEAVLKNLPCDIFISAAAVADRRPKKYSKSKIKKQNLSRIELVDNPDILQTVAEHKQRPNMVVGFAAESDNHLKNARAKLTKKSCDLVVLNDISALGSESNEAWLISDKSEKRLRRSSKEVIAKQIFDEIERLYVEHPDKSKSPSKRPRSRTSKIRN